MQTAPASRSVPDAPADPLVEILVTGEAGTRVPDPGPEPFDLERALQGIPDGGFVDRDWFWANQHRFKWKLAPPGRRAR